MKNTFLLLVLLATCCCADAQKINKSLLAGKWNFYSMNAEGYTFYKDSLQHNINAMIKMQKDKDPNLELSTDDSLKFADIIKPSFTLMAGTYMKFDNKGNDTILLTFDLNEAGKSNLQTGTYEWTAGNQITLKVDGGETQVFIIDLLTDNKLSISSNNPKDIKQGLAMCLTRQ